MVCIHAIGGDQALHRQYEQDKQISSKTNSQYKHVDAVSPGRGMVEHAQSLRRSGPPFAGCPLTNAVVFGARLGLSEEGLKGQGTNQDIKGMKSGLPNGLVKVERGSPMLIPCMTDSWRKKMNQYG